MSGKTLNGSTEEEGVLTTDSDEFLFFIQDQLVAELSPQELTLPIYAPTAGLLNIDTDGVVGVNSNIEADVSNLDARVIDLENQTLDPLTLDSNNSKAGIRSTKPATVLEIFDQSSTAFTDTSLLEDYHINIGRNGLNAGQGCGIAFTVSSGGFLENYPDGYGGSTFSGLAPMAAIVAGRRTDMNFGGNLFFKTRNQSGLFEPCHTRMTIAHTGFVGIGSTDPQYALDVTGSVRATTTSVFGGLQSLGNVVINPGDLTVEKGGGKFSIVNGEATFEKSGNSRLRLEDTSTGGTTLDLGIDGAAAYLSSSTTPLRFNVGGPESMRIATNGNLIAQHSILVPNVAGKIGIGTTVATDGRLHINTGILEQVGYKRSHGVAEDIILEDTIIGANVFYGTRTNNPLILKTNNAGRLTIRADGNIETPNSLGIGVVSPLQPLHVVGNIRVDSGNVGIRTATAQQPLHVVGNACVMSGGVGVGTTSPLSGLGLHVVNSLSSTASTVYIDGGTNRLNLSAVQATGAIVGTQTSNDLNFTTNASTRAVIRAGGNVEFNNSVGIGTAPRQKLDVQGGNVIINTGSLGIGTTSPSQSFHLENGSARFNNSGASSILEINALSFGDIRMTTNTDLDIGTNNSIRATFRGSDGFLGLGTVSPSFRLQLSTDSAAKPTTNTWTVSSDERIKEDIVDADLERCFDIVKAIPLRRFKWRDDLTQPDGRGGVERFDCSEDKRMLGWIAQEVEPIFPKAVKTIPEQWGLKDFKSLQSDQLYKALFGAVKHLSNKVEALEHEISQYREERSQGQTVQSEL